MDMKKPIYQQIKEELQAYIEGLAANTPSAISCFTYDLA